MSSFNDECYVANEEYDAGDRDNGGHTEKPLSSKVASFEDSYMPALVAEENRDDGEIVGDPLGFRGALDPLDSSGGSALDGSNGGIFSGDMVTPQQRIGSMLATSVNRTRNLSNPLVAQPIIGSNLGSNHGSMNTLNNIGSNGNNLGSNDSNIGSNINNLGSNLGSISNNGNSISGGTNLRNHFNLPHAKHLGMCNRYLATINMPSIEDIKYKGITYNSTPKELTSDLYLPNNSQDILALYEWTRK